jgi:uroporphyrinogen III methyltransferase/synthase
MLIEQGAFQVEAVPAYKTVLPGDAGVQRLRVRLGSVDLIAFTSSSTVSNFCKLIGRPPEGLRAAAIGPITAETAREFGFNVVVSPAEYTVKSLAIAIRDYLAARH